MTQDTPDLPMAASSSNKKQKTRCVEIDTLLKTVDEKWLSSGKLD